VVLPRCTFVRSTRLSRSSSILFCSSANDRKPHHHHQDRPKSLPCPSPQVSNTHPIPGQWTGQSSSAAAQSPTACPARRPAPPSPPAGTAPTQTQDQASLSEKRSRPIILCQVLSHNPGFEPGYLPTKSPEFLPTGAWPRGVSEVHACSSALLSLSTVAAVSLPQTRPPPGLAIS
jgi:hypothetical protein